MPHKNVEQTMKALQAQFFSGYTLKYSASKHQKDESECGVYSMYFQFIMNEGDRETQFEKYRKLKNLDYQKMQALRKIIFINPESDQLVNILKRVKDVTEYLKATYVERQMSIYEVAQYLKTIIASYPKPALKVPMLHELSDNKNSGTKKSGTSKETLYFELVNYEPKDKWNTNDKNIVKDYIKKKLSQYDKFDYIPQSDDMR